MKVKARENAKTRLSHKIMFTYKIMHYLRSKLIKEQEGSSVVWKVTRAA
jgi:hypothetical protein